MKNIFLFLAVVSLATMTSCDKEDLNVDEFGEVMVKFDNYVGNSLLQIDENGSTNYRYQNSLGQVFNITRFGYYISHVKLQGPNGELFEDEMVASASEVKGYYRVVQGDQESYQIQLKNVPSGQYNKISFTVGVREDGIQEGAVGGILDRAAGAWFWNWNSGFIHWLFEGHSPLSARQNNTLQFHIGGWRNIPSEDPNQPQRFFDNNVELTLDFDATVRVSKDLRPSTHIHMDLSKMVDEVDFSEINSIHSPAAGKPFAERLREAFYVDHTHQ